MKRLNPATNAYFRYGNVREDGFLFLKYKTHKVKKNGFFEECWLNPIAFKKELDRMLNHQKTNSEKHNAVCRNYNFKNRDKRNALFAKYYSKKSQRTPQWLTAQQYKQIAEYYKMAKELETVFPWKQHVDHIVPLNGNTVSGLHVPWNLQIMSEKMNKEKSNKVML